MFWEEITHIEVCIQNFKQMDQFCTVNKPTVKVIVAEENPGYTKKTVYLQ
jgi:hypothetical protein